ncbi:hypothetical protein L3H50_01290 [Corynebacterium sp. MC-04]|uniref:Secreted protein n=1 Tax=Corynebacterium parakroppenstedtii TaxID=2828363 RepID=A0ABS9HJG1_9CORY|nr:MULTISPECIES: hypothetical protein [Corynebacterium]KXB51658.1 hypothetical protein HMPREF1861_00077 [Corynebacterium kroppenstedtii]MBY0788108.1 hypothetical protein [Corynebacterium parakroppenstedtii]MBY0792184.1 hypothetical protein [Corynebacterium parakroppenstedtii]MBY0796060.1 hypothetical protein [Corynebacterium parakroppenstedtii]MCF6769133.1 hypothetical protein [Corynebacterium parakroppenstedtii]
MQKRTGEVLKAIRWWIGMAVGLLVFFYLWSLVFKDDSFSWEEWGKTVLFGTLVGVLYWIYSRPKK